MSHRREVLPRGNIHSIEMKSVKDCILHPRRFVQFLDPGTSEHNYVEPGNRVSTDIIKGR